MFAAASSESLDPFLTSALNSLDLFVALAPVAYVSHLQSKILVKMANSDLVERFYKRGKYEFLPYGPLDTAAAEICQEVEHACASFLMAICGPSRHLNASRIQVYVSNTPAGTSLQNMAHWMQGVLVDSFQRYDFGSEQSNIQHYGQAQPPLYNLSSLAVRTALFAGEHDYLADPVDVERLVSELPAKWVVFSDYLQTFAHLDYVWAPSAGRQVYPKVVALLDKYTPL